MRLRHSAPVSWPNDTAWQRAWAEQVHTLERTRVGPDGVVMFPEVEPDDPEIRLVASEHLRPGARYLLGERTSEAELTIEGHHRTARVQYIDSKDAARRITGNCTGSTAWPS